MRWAAGLIPLLLLAPSGWAKTAAPVLTEHYRLEVEGAPATEAAELGRLLEATWAGLEDWFGVAPEQARDARLRVRLFATKEAWHAAMRRDGLTPPPHGGGYYAPTTHTAYLHRQPTTYYTRVLLIHEAVHQFHFLARTHNRAPTAAWYTEGLAEHLSWHTWDGETLRLGQRPWVTLKDHPKTALALLDKKTYDLDAVLEGRVWPDYPLAWALVTYLATGRDGKPLKGFSRFCRKMDRGAAVGPTFRKTFRGGPRFGEDFHAWLRAHPQPWVQVFNQWEDRGDGRLRGHAGCVTLCRTRGAADQLSAAVHVPKEGRWRAGLLLEFQDAQRYRIATIQSDGRWRIERRAAGRWASLAHGRFDSTLTNEGRVRIAAVRRGDQVEVRLGNRTLGRWPATRTPLGLVVDDGDLTFDEVVWSAAATR